MFATDLSIGCESEQAPSFPIRRLGTEFRTELAIEFAMEFAIELTKDRVTHWEGIGFASSTSGRELFFAICNWTTSRASFVDVSLGFLISFRLASLLVPLLVLLDSLLVLLLVLLLVGSFNLLNSISIFLWYSPRDGRITANTQRLRLKL